MPEPETQTYTYGYLPNSDLLQQLTSNHGVTVTRTDEPNRDVLTQVQNTFNSTVISQYDYTYDALHRRTSMATSGTAFDTSPDPVVEPDTLNYTTNNLNQYTDIQSTVSSIQLTYDLDGNLINDGIHQFTYVRRIKTHTCKPPTPGVRRDAWSRGNFGDLSLPPQ